MGRNRGVCARCWYPKATSRRPHRQRFVDRSAQACPLAEISLELECYRLEAGGHEPTGATFKRHRPARLSLTPRVTRGERSPRAAAVRYWDAFLGVGRRTAPSLPARARSLRGAPSRAERLRSRDIRDSRRKSVSTQE